MAYIEFLTDKIGRCDHCELRDSPLYLYSDHKKMTTEVRCEDCIPRCSNVDCEELALSEEHDFCEKCEEKNQERLQDKAMEDAYDSPDRDAWKHEAAEQQRLK